MITRTRTVLALAAAAALTGAALAAPAQAMIAQPSCWARSARCLTATPAPPPIHYHTGPNLKYQATPGTSGS
jgi:hypothetical protein